MIAGYRWELVLEYALGAVTVAIGWSGYVVSFLRDVGINVPCALSAARGLTVQCADGSTAIAMFNLPAVLIIAIVTTLLVIGIKESANVNNIIVFVKVAVVLLFIVGAVHAINPANWHPFIPPNTGVRGEFGWTGVMTGAGIVFFAYIGFDAVSTAAQEAKNPQKDMPIGIIGSLLICTVLYILVAGIAAGVTPYKELNSSTDRCGRPRRLGWIVLDHSSWARCATSLVILGCCSPDPCLFTMSRDVSCAVSGANPPVPDTTYSIIVTGIGVAIDPPFLPCGRQGSCLDRTLLAFVNVSIGIRVLRV